jgi:hypothetical protein
MNPNPPVNWKEKKKRKKNPYNFVLIYICFYSIFIPWLNLYIYIYIYMQTMIHTCMLFTFYHVQVNFNFKEAATFDLLKMAHYLQYDQVGHTYKQAWDNCSVKREDKVQTGRKINNFLSFYTHMKKMKWGNSSYWRRNHWKNGMKIWPR